MNCQHWRNVGFSCVECCLIGIIDDALSTLDGDWFPGGGFRPHIVNIGDGWVANPLCGRLLIVNIGGLGRVDAAGVNIGGLALLVVMPQVSTLEDSLGLGRCRRCRHGRAWSR